MATPQKQNTPSTPEQLQGAQIKALRLQQGLTQTQVAKATGVHTTTLRGWEQGTGTPKFWRGASIAAALGVPVAALFAPAGFVAVTDVQLTPEAVARVRREGKPAADRLAQQIAAQLPALILATCRTKQPANKEGRGKPRRSRAEVLAGIAEANTMRQAAQARRRTVGPPEGGAKESVGGLPGGLTAEQ